MLWRFGGKFLRITDRNVLLFVNSGVKAFKDLGLKGLVVIRTHFKMCFVVQQLDVRQELPQVRWLRV